MLGCRAAALRNSSKVQDREFNKIWLNIVPQNDYAAAFWLRSSALTRVKYAHVGAAELHFTHVFKLRAALELK